MDTVEFREIESDKGRALTYECGCYCVPVAGPADDGSPGFEHCCCGKVHFVGRGARRALEDYLADRRRGRGTVEPQYVIGGATAPLGQEQVEVAWAFPAE
ncbi:MAG: hypothetical protein ACE5EF_03640 [Dehalococcoidia bacterium]